MNKSLILTLSFFLFSSLLSAESLIYIDKQELNQHNNTPILHKNPDASEELPQPIHQGLKQKQKEFNLIDQSLSESIPEDTGSLYANLDNYHHPSKQNLPAPQESQPSTLGYFIGNFEFYHYTKNYHLIELSLIILVLFLFYLCRLQKRNSERRLEDSKSSDSTNSFDYFY